MWLLSLVVKELSGLIVGARAWKPTAWLLDYSITEP